MPTCILCPSDLTLTTRWEHVLLDAFGGRMKTRTAICSSCNERLGGTIDSAFAAQVTEFRNLLQLGSGSGDPPPKLKKVTIGNQQLNIAEDGSPQLTGRPFTINHNPDGSWNLQMQVQTEAQFQKALPHIAAQLGIPEADLKRQLEASGSFEQITWRPGTFGLALGVGGPEALRSIVKSGFVLWSTHVGNDEMRSKAFGAARNFVLNSDHNFNLEHCSLDTRPLPISASLVERFGPLFNFLFLRSDGQGRVVGHFTLYNYLGWQFVLAESGGTPNTSIALASNPELPSVWTAAAAIDFDLPMAWLSTPDRENIAPVRERLAAINQHYQRTAGGRQVGRLAGESAASLGFAPDQAITPAETLALWNRLHDPLKHFLLGTSDRRELTPEQVANLLKKNPTCP